MLTPDSVRDRLRQTMGGLPRPFWVLWTGTLVNRLGTFVVPFMAVYLTQVRGFTMVQAGMVAALWGAGGVIAGPVGGFLADRYGRRSLMVAALGLGGAGMIALGFASRAAVIAPATFVVALISEMYRPGVQAAIADVVPPGDRVRAYGLLYWVINVGFGIGIALAGWLASVSFLLLFIGDGLTSIAFAFLVWRGVPETRPVHAEGSRAAAEGPGSFFAPYRDRTFLLFLVLSVLVITIFMQHNSTFPLDMSAHGLSKKAFGSVLALNGLVIVLVQPFLGPLLARHNRSRVLAFGSTLVALGFGMNAIARTAPVYALGVIVWTIGEIGVLPVANAVIADLAPPHLRGRYQGGYGLSWGVAAVVAPTLGSFVLQRFGSAPLWLGCLVLGLLVAAGHLAIARRLTHVREARVLAHAVGAPAIAPTES